MFQATEDDLSGMTEVSKTWVELVLLQALSDNDLVARGLHEALDFHRAVSGQAAGHLHLLAENT